MNSTDLKFLKNNKIVLAVSDTSHFYRPLSSELKKFGFDVTIFDYRKNNLFEKVLWGLSYLNPEFKKKAIKHRNKRVINLVKEKNASVFFASKGELIFKETIKTLKEMGVLTINWYSDWFHGFKGYRGILGEYNFIFTADSFDVYLHKSEMNVFHMPYGAWSYNKRNIFDKKKYDLVFIGTWTIEREIMMYKLRKFKPLIWGNDMWGKGSMKGFYQDAWLGPDEVLKILSDAKITINQSQWDAQLHTTLNVRAYEAAANGVLTLTDYRGDLKSLFKVNGVKKEMVLFSDYNELPELVEYYLSHKKERIRIAKRAFNKAINKHHYKNRIKEIFTLINLNFKN